jgi:small GTP-binding protein
MTQSERAIKVLLLGDALVGKTSLLRRFTADSFADDTKATIGVDFVGHKSIIDGVFVDAQLWDTAGEERYRALSGITYRGAHAALVVYDVTSRESFDHAAEWTATVRQLACEGCVVALVGNKTDLTHIRTVSCLEGETLRAELGASSFTETSAFLDPHSVATVFDATLLAAHRTAFPRDVPLSADGVHRRRHTVDEKSTEAPEPPAATAPPSRAARLMACCTVQ